MLYCNAQEMKISYHNFIRIDYFPTQDEVLAKKMTGNKSGIDGPVDQGQRLYVK